MALPREYLGEDCALARALEIVGERWTLLIVRDAFYGVRRFSDFRDHLGIPRAVLTDRLNLLVSGSGPRCGRSCHGVTTSTRAVDQVGRSPTTGAGACWEPTVSAPTAIPFQRRAS